MGLKRLATAFYAIMGGFARGEGNRPIETIPFRDLLSEIIIRRALAFPIEDIADKSKAGLIGKLLACVQDSWLLVQCFGRKLQGLPITLLELNTVVHVLTAICMYGLWWDKPSDVSRPSVLITVENLHGLGNGEQPLGREEFDRENNAFSFIRGDRQEMLDREIQYVRDELREWDGKHGRMNNPGETGGQDETQSPTEPGGDLDEIRMEGPDKIQKPTKVPLNRMAVAAMSASSSSLRERERLRGRLQSLVEGGRWNWLRNPFASFLAAWWETR